MKKKSFTLVEIMIVVAIIAILAAIAVPSLSANRESAMKQTRGSNVKLCEAGIVQALAADPALNADEISWAEMSCYMDSTDKTTYTVGGWTLDVTNGEASYTE